MKAPLKSTGLLLVILVAFDWSAGADHPIMPAEEVSQLNIDTRLKLDLRVKSTAFEADDADLNQLLQRRLESEQSLWAMLQMQMRVDPASRLDYSPTIDRSYHKWYRTGIGYLRSQAYHYARKWRNRPINDPFKEFFGYTDVLERSRRSMPCRPCR